MTVELFVLGVIAGILAGLLCQHRQHLKSNNKSDTEKLKHDIYCHDMQIRHLILGISDLENKIERLDEFQKLHENLSATVDDEEQAVANYYKKERENQ